ncbi:MAG: hypothetical protein IKX00_05275 [Bacilli bacterium]|nr:hypothetical protein [Bacilli bacterium]
MEYLVDGHNGGMWVDNRDPEEITETCEECGDYDRIILSWEEGKALDAFKSHFGCQHQDETTIKYSLNHGCTYNDVLEYTRYLYEDDRVLINYLFSEKIITNEEKLELFKTSIKAENMAIALVNKCAYELGNGRIRI